MPKQTKGIILAGGAGSRLYPLSKIYSKQLVAVFDKPMIYYPLTTLVAAGINEILIISDEKTLPFYKKLFLDSDKIGLNIDFATQKKPNGIAEAFIIGQKFIGKDNVALILGDNIFYGCDNIFYETIHAANNAPNFKNTIFSLFVNEPERYGVVRFSPEGYPNSIVEKPTSFVSNYAVPGFYVFDNSVVKIAQQLTPSARGELEITDINNYYLKKQIMNIQLLKRNNIWLDSGTPQSLLNASNFVASFEERHAIKLGCYEEAAFKMKLINKQQLVEYANTLPICNYKEYLLKIANNCQKNLFENNK